jgi:heme-degrading monooxygenase HmoA
LTNLLHDTLADTIPAWRPVFQSCVFFDQRGPTTPTRNIELVTSTPGYVRHYSFRDEQSREGVTISYFDDDDSIIEWKSAARHQEAQQRGRDTFYSNYSIDIAHVVRHYDWGTTPSSTS